MIIEIWLSYSLACILSIMSPGPDNILVFGRGVSQGKSAAIMSSAGAALSMLAHVLIVTLGLQLSSTHSIFLVQFIKIIGASYLIYIGGRALMSRNLISFSSVNALPLNKVLLSGFLTNFLNPKSALFIIAFIPIFISNNAENIAEQTLLLGIWFVLLAFIVFSVIGIFATKLSNWLINRNYIINGLNIVAALVFILSGMSIFFI